MTSSCNVMVFMLLLTISLVFTNSKKRATYRFTTCNSTRREGPTFMECIKYYNCSTGHGSPVCNHLIPIMGLFGSQVFAIPRSGNYTVTIAGASGGHGVCSNYSGLGVIAREAVHFNRGQRFRILVGQQGKSACDGHQDIDICQISNDTKACTNLWNAKYRRENLGHYYSFDGGAGGGGASLLQFLNGSTFQFLNGSFTPTVIAPGGGGAGAIQDIATFLLSSNFSDNNFDGLDEFYRNYTNGHPFETFSDKADGIEGETLVSSAGAGAGFLSTTANPSALVNFGFGGTDCNENAVRFSLFPDTHGGFGGGGGGCDGGGGGGGYTGGSIIADGVTIPGEGGYSWPDPPWPLIGYNDGDGYVELFLESCGCTYNCIIDDQSSFECSCPSDTTLALNGFDCYTEENYYFEAENEENQTLFTHPKYGIITADIIQLSSPIFAYSAAVVFSNESLSNSCAILFMNSFGCLIATTKFGDRSNEIQHLKLFSVNSSSVPQNDTICKPELISLSMNSQFMLKEPLLISFVITFGIDGDCILEELVVNASIDDIFVNYPENPGSVNLTNKDILRSYLDSFNSLLTGDHTSTTNDNSLLSTGVIAGIVIGAIAMIICIAVMLVICICQCCQIISLKDDNSVQEDVVLKDKDDKIIKVKDHEYQTLICNEYENVQNDEELINAPAQPRRDTLKYGFESPFQNYYLFNCSRQDTEDWSYDRAQLIYMREIGEGQFGKVLLMKAKDICGVQGSVLVAVKTLTSRDPKDIQRFLEEMDLMKKFIHPNIVSLLGHCEATSDGAPMIILELMQYGDLKWFLESHRPTETEDSVITDKIALNIVTDVASGLEYLADNHYVHRDVAARNCLLGDGFRAKLSDFGLARGVHEKDYYRVTGQTKLPVRWMAPESLLYGKFTSATDVWSFGVLVWEVATFGERPHDNLKVDDIIEMASSGTLQLISPAGCPDILASIISQCNRIQFDDRPTFTEILESCYRKNLPTIIEQVPEQSFRFETEV